MIGNHALLLSDLMTGGSVLPEYDILIIDEAHHLEEEATRHLGFELGRSGFDEYLHSLGGERGLLSEAVTAFRGSSAAATRRRAVEQVVARTAPLIPDARDSLARLFASLQVFISEQGDGGSERGDDIRITSATRAQPDWSQLEIQWEKVDVWLSELGSGVNQLQISLEGLEDAELIDYEGLMMEMANVQQVGVELRQRLAEFVTQPKENGIYWVTWRNRGEDSVLHAAPLHVGEILDKILFSRKECVVMTSATLSANESFAHVCERTGFAEPEELLLGSPFDYSRAALLCVPEDMPEPQSVGLSGRGGAGSDGCCPGGRRTDHGPVHLTRVPSSHGGGYSREPPGAWNYRFGSERRRHTSTADAKIPR